MRIAVPLIAQFVKNRIERRCGKLSAIPGLIKMGRESEEEKQFRNSYSPAQPTMDLRDRTTQPLGRTFATPPRSTTF
jgi:hypothetical protein